MSAVLCPKCQVDLLAHASPEQPVDGLRCPRCRETYRKPWSREEPPRASPQPDLVGGRFTGFPFVLDVEPQGTVTLTMRLPDRRLIWRGSVEQMAALGDAARYVASEAKALVERKTGADRWSFRRIGEQMFASMYADWRELERFAAGHRQRGRAPLPCSACDAPIQPGETAYRPMVPTSAGRVCWHNVRFCEACIGKVPDEEQRPRPVLRLVRGGGDGGQAAG